MKSQNGRLVVEEVGSEEVGEGFGGEDAEEDGAEGGDGQDDVDGEGEARGGGGGDFGAGFAHVHDDDEANVVVGANDAVDGHEDGEPDEVGVYGGFEDVELAEEACGDRQAEKRKQE